MKLKLSLTYINRMEIIYMKIHYFLVAFLACLCIESISFSQTSTEYQKQKRNKHDWRNDVKTIYYKKNIFLDAIYTGDFFSNVAGGNNRNSEYLHVMDIMVTGSLDSLLNWRNVTFAVDIIGINGGNPSDHAGDFQGVSNIAAPRSLKLYETWFQINVVKERLSFLLGMYDLNSEFDVIETAGLFINSSFGMGPEFSHSGRSGAPTFPYPGLGLRIKARLSEDISLKVAVMDGDTSDPNNSWSDRYCIRKDEGALCTLEFSFVADEEKLISLAPTSKRRQHRRRRIGFDMFKKTIHKSINRIERNRENFIEMRGENYSKFSLGGWYYTDEFDDFLNIDEAGYPKCQKGSWGLYSLGEKVLWQNLNNPIQAMSVFIRAGISDKKVNQVDMSFAGGFIYSGNFFKHFQDQIGWAITAARMGDTFQNVMSKEGKVYNDWEIAAEISYRSQINKTWSLQPDIQYIINPGYDPNFDNALVTGIRIEASL